MSHLAFDQLLQTKPAIVLDGALGTMLMQHGLRPGDADAADLWNLTRPETVHAVHAAYCAAGADILLTNTFGANAGRLAAYGAVDHLHTINTTAVQLARAAAEPTGALVGGSIGPLGRALPPDVAAAAWAQQAAVLRAAGVDVLWLETLLRLDDALSALRAVSDGGPVCVTVTFSADTTTADGHTPADVARALHAHGAAALGVNCAAPPLVEHVLAQMRAAVPHAVLIGRANAGLPVRTDDGWRWPVGPRRFAAHADRLRALGVRLVGGCCGTTPATIAAIAKSTRRMVTTVT